MLSTVMYWLSRPVLQGGEHWTTGYMGKMKSSEQGGGSWVFRDIPRDLMHRMKIAAAVERKSVKQLLIELSYAHLTELEKKGLLPKGK